MVMERRERDRYGNALSTVSINQIHIREANDGRSALIIQHENLTLSSVDFGGGNHGVSGAASDGS